MKKILKLVCPPIIPIAIKRFTAKKTVKNSKKQAAVTLDSNKQDLDLYWEPEYAEVLEVWGKDSVWNEIQMLLGPCKGKVLDIACGTGITMKILEKFPELELHGFDISDLLIQKAEEKNIPKNRLKVADATKTNYQSNEFDYSFSIGSLEHFTLEGIDQFIMESSKVTSKVSFHMIPVSKSNKNEGWMKTVQSFFNNSEDWWLEKFSKHYKNVYPIPSKWEDPISFGRWYICINEL